MLIFAHGIFFYRRAIGASSNFSENIHFQNSFFLKANPKKYLQL